MSLIELSDTRQQKIRKMTNNPSQHLKIVVIILILPTDDAVPFLVLIPLRMPNIVPLCGGSIGQGMFERSLYLVEVVG